MENINCRRFDILLANLIEEGIEKEHYILCVSNWKNNIKSDSINAIFISSKLKMHPSHVFFKGEKYGLNKESVIKCEKLFTVKKNKIIKKIGNISDIYTQLEIEKGLECQLQLDEKYANIDIEQLEKLFKERVVSMNDMSIYDNLKFQIRDYAYKSQYSKCVGTCTELIELINKNKISDKNYLHYAYYHRSLMFNNLKEYEMALVDAKESLKFVGNIKYNLNTKYSYSMWSISNLYDKLGKTEESISVYYTLAKYYKKIGKTNMRITMLFNIAKQKKNFQIMNILINMMKNIDFQEYETNKTKEILLKEMNDDLINLKKAN